MPKIPTFKQPGQGFGIQPALENSQAGRAKGEQFGAFARTAASAVAASSQFVQKSEEARLRNAVDIAEEGALEDDRQARMFADKKGKADGSDLESIYSGKLQELSDTRMQGIEDDGERKAVTGLYRKISSKSADKLFTRSRAMRVTETTRLAQQKRNMRASTVFVDPSLLDEKLERVDQDFSNDVDAGMFNENQRGKVVTADKSAYVQSALNSLINDGKTETLGLAKEILQEKAGFLKPGQAGNYLNLITSKQMKAMEDKFSERERNNKRADRQIKETQEDNSRKFYSDLRKAKKNGFPESEQREFEERLDKLVENEGISIGGPEGAYKMQDQLSSDDQQVQSELAGGFNDDIDRATSTFHLDKVRTNILSNRKQLSVETADGLINDINLRKSELQNTDTGYQEELRSSKSLISAATNSDVMIKLMKGKAKAKASIRKAMITDMARQFRAKGLRPMEAADKAIEEIEMISGVEDLGKLGPLTDTEQNDLSDFRGKNLRVIKKKLRAAYPNINDYEEQLILLHRKKQRLLYQKRLDISIRSNSAR